MVNTWSRRPRHRLKPTPHKSPKPRRGFVENGAVHFNGWLKTIMKCHECNGTPACRNEQMDTDSFKGTLRRAGTLDASDLNGDGEISVLDIDATLRKA